MKILLIEDDKLFNETIQDFLEEEGYKLQTALDPYSALEISYKSRFDLYLFDVNLPYESGFDLLEKLRASGDKTPTIFLTSRDDKASMIEGFDIGADDYMKKPIDLDELLLRIRAVLRRQTRGDKIKLGEYLLDCNAKRIYYNSKPLSVTNKAVELLLLLVLAKGEVVRVEEIENHLWHVSQDASLGAIRVYITTLKKYFPDNIENIRGVGYRFI
ncbi:two-component response regulator [hydrothermal vent metagenome]|uniref:Two-component response regulator n=1 Tax=hydrothermal vent metagenome TaxID=652676 RepID=A0A1W1C297_9ZZZZ